MNSAGNFRLEVIDKFNVAFRKEVEKKIIKKMMKGTV